MELEDGDAAETDDVTFLEMLAGDEDILVTFLTGGVLVTGVCTFLILAAEEEDGVCLVLMEDGDDDPSISKLMSSKEMVSLFRMTLDLALDWRLDLR